MKFLLKAGTIQVIIIAVAAILFFLCAFWGYFSGKNTAISNTVIHNASQLELGFGYFKSDQDRYPTSFEYSNHDLMGIYFSVFPPANIATKPCQTNFAYESNNSKTYNLDFCIPKSSGRFTAGWNRVNPPPIVE